MNLKLNKSEVRSNQLKAKSFSNSISVVRGVWWKWHGTKGITKAVRLSSTTPRPSASRGARPPNSPSHPRGIVHTNCMLKLG